MEDSGYYSCKSGGVQAVVFLDVIGVYDLSSALFLRSHFSPVGISFPFLSTSQSCTMAKSCQILCRVRANPAAEIDWKKVDSVKQMTGEGYTNSTVMYSHVGTDPEYRMTPEGLLIRNVSRQDEGGYICRARVAETGQLEERMIQLKVIVVMVLLKLLSVMIKHQLFQIQEIPSWLSQPVDKTFLEGKYKMFLVMTELICER